jgi:hypothetical protein
MYEQLVGVLSILELLLCGLQLQLTTSKANWQLTMCAPPQRGRPVLGLQS